MRHVLLLLLLFASAAAFAESDVRDEQHQLEAELKSVRQEQQSVYQNYQMTKELRLMEVQEGLPPTSGYPYGKDVYGTNLYTPPPNYDEVMRAQLEREKRIRQYSDDLRALAARYLELEEERKALIEEIRELRQRQNEP